jgi:putative photosynthetic complex assembly protein
MSEEAIDAQPFPRLPLLGAGALIALAFVAAFSVRMTGGNIPVETSTPVAALNLKFVDQTDGSVAVLNGDDGSVVETVKPGTNGFLRSTMRGFARERKRSSIGPETPFRLTAWADGRLTLVDSATGRRVELEAFGPTNEQVFANLLAEKVARP